MVVCINNKTYYNATATTEIDMYGHTVSLDDARPISTRVVHLRHETDVGDIGRADAGEQPRTRHPFERGEPFGDPVPIPVVASLLVGPELEIGRASCRERVCQYV